jgi:hypothetical protein
MSTSDTSARSAHVVLSIFTALALTVFVNARAAWAQDVADSGAGADANWVKVEPAEPAGPVIDEDAASAEKVLEIPQAKCPGDDDDSDACNRAAPANNDSSDNDQSINPPSPGAAPQTFDEDAYNQPDADWGDVDEYQNPQAYNVPYVVYSYSTGVIGTLHRPTPAPGSTFAPTTTPLTQAARPPLNQGPWMTRPSTMSAFSRPSGGPMMMSAPLAGFHR